VANYSTKELKQGLKIILENEPYVILSHEFLKPGKGQAYYKIKVKNLLTSRVNEKTFKSGASVEAADVLEVEMQYLYCDKENFFFMNTVTYEQILITREVVTDIEKWLKTEDLCVVTLYNGRPVIVHPPNFVELKVIETDPGLKGDTASGGVKPATLDTGAIIKVPLFIQEADLVQVDTRTGEYVARVKN